MQERVWWEGTFHEMTEAARRFAGVRVSAQVTMTPMTGTRESPSRFIELVRDVATDLVVDVTVDRYTSRPDAIPVLSDWLMDQGNPWYFLFHGTMPTCFEDFEILAEQARFYAGGFRRIVAKPLSDLAISRVELFCGSWRFCPGEET
jgi:hypothetical protein